MGADAAADVYEGGPGGDFVSDDAGSDLLDGGAGTDTLIGLFSLDPLVVDLARGRAAGVAEVNTLAGIENVLGSISSDLIVGDDGPNVLMGLFEPDVVLGAGGADLLLSGIDGDLLDGGDATDAVLATGNRPVEADLEEGTVTRGAVTPDRLNDVEDFIGTAADDVIAGNEEGNRLYGGSGHDAVSGRGGDDVLFGDSPFEPWIDIGKWKTEYRPRGQDLLAGGEGADLLDGGPFADVCRTGERLRHCESTRGDGSRPVAARALGPPVPGPLQAWFRRVLAADAPAGITGPRLPRRGR